MSSIDLGAKALPNREIPKDEDLSEIRPGALALIVETFLDNHKVPLHIRCGALFMLIGNYLNKALNPNLTSGDDA